MSRPITRRGSTNDWTPVPNGSYHQRVVSVTHRNPDEEKEALMVKCAIIGGGYAEKTTVHWLHITPKAMFRIGHFVDAIGADTYDEVETGEKDAEGKPVVNITFDPDEWPGLEFVADAELDTQYNNNKWTQYRAAPGTAQPAQASVAAPAPAQAAPVAGGERRRRTALRA